MFIPVSVIRRRRQEKANRPRLQIPRTQFEISLEMLSIVILVVSIIYVWSVWSTLPDRIPSHFNFKGEVDGYSGKASLLIINLAEIFIYALLTILSRFPHIYNYPFAITEQNAPRQYLLARTFMTGLKTEIILVFSYLEIQTIRVGFGKATGMGYYFILMFIGLIFASTAIYFIKAYQAK